jgi:chromatin remodeling complex protein RSC6
MKQCLQVVSVVILILIFESPLLSAQTQPQPPTSRRQVSQQERLELLLNRETEALVHLQQLLPAIRCEYPDHIVSENCRSFCAQLAR